MNSLLRWSIENMDANRQPQSGGQRPDPQKIDPGIIDAILGKPDSELMKEALATATDEKANEDDRLTALDNFEMVSSSYVSNKY